jgi:RNA polymerase sigma factor (sigma-70 family)
LKGAKVDDSDLVGAARSGDAAGFALLVRRHHAAMRAVALAVLGWHPDLDDVVQDATLVALRRLDDLRDPAAAGAWLKAITRNTARMRLRSARPGVPVEAVADRLPAAGGSPEEVVDARARRGWLWTALHQLSEPLQLVVLLRYFTPVTAYDQIAEVCGVPVGTVRSRLSEARRRLTAALAAAGDAAHTDIDRLTAHRRATAEHLLASAPQGRFEDVLAQVAAEDLHLVGPQGLRARGQQALVRIMRSDLEAGVRQRLGDVIAGTGLTIWHSDLLSPPDDPYHCPPGVLWVTRHADGRLTHITLYHPRVEATA